MFYAFFRGKNSQRKDDELTEKSLVVLQLFESERDEMQRQEMKITKRWTKRKERIDLNTFRIIKVIIEFDKQNNRDREEEARTSAQNVDVERSLCVCAWCTFASSFVIRSFILFAYVRAADHSFSSFWFFVSINLFWSQTKCVHLNFIRIYFLFFISLSCVFFGIAFRFNTFFAFSLCVFFLWFFIWSLSIA